MALWHISAAFYGKMSGRLTLNPLAFIDLFGTVLLSLMLVLMGS